VFPNVGTKGTGEPVVQPAERRKSVLDGPWLFPLIFSVGFSTFRPLWAVAGLAALVLAGCGQPVAQTQAEFTAVPAQLPVSGGEVSFFWQAEGAGEVTVTSEPALPGFPLTTRERSFSVKLRGNPTTAAKTYRFTLELATPQGRVAKTQTVTVEPQASVSCPSSSQPALRAALAMPAPLKPAGLGRFDRPYAAGRLLVFSRSDSRLRKMDAMRLGGGWGLLRVPQGQEAAQARALVEQGLADYAQPEYLYQPAQAAVPPANRQYPAQGELFAQMRLEQAWKGLLAGCERPVVAVADTGFFTERADLAPNLTPRASWLDVVGASLEAPQPRQGVVTPHGGNSHGTAVASVIAATTNDGSMLAGVSYNLAQVLPIKIFDAQGRTGTLQIAQALEYAAGQTQIGGQTFTNPTPAQVVNLSLSGQAYDPYLESVLARVTAQGLVVVAASGNGDSASVAYPASSPYVIAVGATDAQGRRAVWGSGFGSNYGPELDFVAPGTAVPSYGGQATDAVGNAYGTSMSAAFVSATVALRLYQNQRQYGTFYPEGAGGQVLRALQGCLRSAAQFPVPSLELGYGLIDVSKVLDLANAACG
jgi:subtilisin family serine protease